jgi:hypothetical protein
MSADPIRTSSNHRYSFGANQVAAAVVSATATADAVGRSSHPSRASNRANARSQKVESDVRSDPAIADLFEFTTRAGQKDPATTNLIHNVLRANVVCPTRWAEANNVDFETRVHHRMKRSIERQNV